MDKIIMCGGRDFNDADCVCRTFDALYGPWTLIEGGARGADRLARQEALERGIGVLTVNADWDKHGKSAGPIRNIQMAQMNPVMVIAFPGGRGTEHMIKTANTYGIPVRRVNCVPRPEVL